MRNYFLSSFFRCQVVNFYLDDCAPDSSRLAREFGFELPLSISSRLKGFDSESRLPTTALGLMLISCRWGLK